MNIFWAIECQHRQAYMLKKSGMSDVFAYFLGDPWHEMDSAVHTGIEKGIVVCDVIVVGAGMVGLALACALGTEGLRVTVIDRQDFNSLKARSRDGRTSAIAAGSRRVLARADAWNAMEDAAQPILEIRVSDGASPLFLHYDHALLDEGPLGWIVENADIRAALLERARTLQTVEMRGGVAVESLVRNSHAVEARLSDGTRVEASLAVAADGHDSPMRRNAGIGVIAWRYDQTSIVCTVAHERPHRGIAHERFLPAGPFAILPMIGNRSSIVWTERASLVPGLVALVAHGTQLRAGAALRRFSRHRPHRRRNFHLSAIAQPRAALHRASPRTDRRRGAHDPSHRRPGL